MHTLQSYNNNNSTRFEFTYSIRRASDKGRHSELKTYNSSDSDTWPHVPKFISEIRTNIANADRLP
jgi:hypothetical protein